MKSVVVMSFAVSFSLLVGGVSYGSTKEKGESGSNEPSCAKYEAAASKAYNFGAHNFHQGYAVNEDFEGARAQLFLIEEGLKGEPVGSFAVNYKSAEEFYEKTLSAAKAEGCDTSEYPISPVAAFRKGVATLEAKSK